MENSFITMDNIDEIITALEKRFNNDILKPRGSFRKPTPELIESLENERIKRNEDKSIEERVSYLEDELNKRVASYYEFAEDGYVFQKRDDDMVIKLNLRQREKNKHMDITKRVEWLQDNWRTCGYIFKE